MAEIAKKGGAQLHRYAHSNKDTRTHIHTSDAISDSIAELLVKHALAMQTVPNMTFSVGLNEVTNSQHG